MEPNLSPGTKTAIQVPDATMEDMRLPRRFFAAAQQYGAVIKSFIEVLAFVKLGQSIAGVRWVTAFGWPCHCNGCRPVSIVIGGSSISESIRK
jgi:hypothetical protein